MARTWMYFRLDLPSTMGVVLPLSISSLFVTMLYFSLFCNRWQIGKDTYLQLRRKWNTEIHILDEGHQGCGQGTRKYGRLPRIDQPPLENFKNNENKNKTRKRPQQRRQQKFNQKAMENKTTTIPLKDHNNTKRCNLVLHHFLPMINVLYVPNIDNFDIWFCVSGCAKMANVELLDKWS